MTPWALRQAKRYLRQGGIIAYPTEAVYGLGCDPLNDPAVKRLLVLKQRSWHKGLILIAADYRQLEPWLQPLSVTLQQQVLASWPGPVTWLLPAHPQVSPWLRGQSTLLAVRVTAHPQAAALCHTWGGPLVSTSANLSGRPMAKTALQVRRLTLSAQLSYILPGRVGQQHRPTEIRHGLTQAILRV
ncbi:MAG: Sua5/YciO/YrdC/YwlC family protein [Pseudomonadota bacterium]|nr:Sua5/YciO/YrdC/YwlC family protein [Pseudomonadota bacterium]